MSTNERHPVTRTWTLPPADRAPLGGGLSRTNLRELAARPGRFEHHLVVVAKAGAAQLEVATASEPLYFAHANLSDEYALPLRTGDAMLDAATFRVFLADPVSGEDAARVNHRAGDLVLHPYGWLHWPGKLRAPYEPPPFPPGGRRAVLSAVFCASRPTEPGERPLYVARGREADAKAYVEPAPPMLLAPLGQVRLGVVARVGAAHLRVATPPFALARGGYVLVLEADDDGGAFEGDLVHVPPGAIYDGRGAKRALVFESSEADAEPPPPSWARVPDAPFAPCEQAPPGALPVREGELEVHEASEREVEVRVGSASARVPRYWLARMLFRLGLHGFALGYVETYGGFFYDDRGPRVLLGVRGAGHVAVDRERVGAVVEALYRAVAPPGYVEDLIT